MERKPIVGGSRAEKRGKPIWEAGVPKNMEACLLYNLLRLVLFKDNHNGVGKFGEETEWPFVFGLIDF